MPEIAIPVAGVRVGHWTGARTGVTVVLAPDGTVGSGEVRGGAPATRGARAARTEPDGRRGSTRWCSPAARRSGSPRPTA